MASTRHRTGEKPPTVPSGLGFASLGVSMLSLASCLVISGLSMGIVPSLAFAVALLPLLGLTGVILGAASLLRKRAPNGREYERGPAMGGIIVGIATGVLQGAFGIGVLRVYLAVPDEIVPVVSAMVREIESSDVGRAREALAEPVRAAVPEARLEGFHRVVRDACGGEITVSFTLGTIGRARSALSRAMAGVGVAPDNFFPKPVEMVGPAARVPVWVLVDDAALQRDQVKLADMMALLPDDRLVVLLPDGRFAQLARASGLEVVALPIGATPPTPDGTDGAPGDPSGPQP